MVAHWQQVYGLPRQQAYAGIESLRQHNVVSRVSRFSIWRPQKRADPGNEFVHSITHNMDGNVCGPSHRCYLKI